MKTHFYYCILSASLLVSACTGNKNQIEKDNFINLEKAITELTELKASDFGKTIRYVPLETTDESLIADIPSIRVLKDKIIVITVKQCFSFDKKTGKFITQIGHIGDDPEAYSNSYFWIDDENETLYFLRKPNQLMGYDTEGNYKGKIEIQGKRMPSYFVFSGPHIIGSYNNELEYGENSLAVFNRNGEMIDSIPTRITNLGEMMKDVNSINVFRTTTNYGNWLQNGGVILNYASENASTIGMASEVLWKNNHNVYYKEVFNDTIYTLVDNELEPRIAFHTGNWNWPETERLSTENNNRRLVVTYANETDNIIFFQCIQGLYADMIIYNGLYDKKTGTTKLAKYKDEILDDIHEFMPLQIRAISPDNEYAGLIEAPDALAWLEDNPVGDTSPELAFLKELNEDMNPIVVLIK